MVTKCPSLLRRHFLRYGFTGSEYRVKYGRVERMSTGASPSQIRSAVQATNAAGTNTRSVQEARERLTFKSDTRPEFVYELLLMFVKNELSASLAIPLLAVIVALASMIWAPAQEVILWLCGVLISKGILLALCRKFTKLPQAGINLREWRSKLMAAEFLYGTTWAGIAFVSVGSNDQTAYMFVFACLMVVIAMRMMFASTVMPIVYAGTIPLTGALVIRFAFLDTPFYWAMAAMTVGVHIYFIVLMKGLNTTVMTMLEYRAEKELLIAELEQSKAISDEARRRAEAANIAKSRFLATMSHELRTPLNAVLGFSEVMKSEILGAHSVPTYKEYANDIHESGQHLLNLINEILDLSRIEAGRYELQEEAVTLTDVAEDCHRLLKLRAGKKGLTIIQNFQENLPQIWADERALRQVCLNLLSNAIKFTPPGGSISLTVGPLESGGQFLSVNDTGPGIPEEEIPRVLKSFGQGSLAHVTAEGGTGLGLPIVMGLVDLHGGTFDLKSKLRRGTLVTVTFPSERVMQALPRLSEPGENQPVQGQQNASGSAWRERHKDTNMRHNRV
ncbi:MAG TPA: HAMP domain-containing histidine kinase [Rhizobiales bacterium]|nr:non-motile and phage-resistance protein [bacterium BMS3Bbin10]HDO51235.1 HAMP domain-containing histidine kinase [Hyphomicrobiales bacterium]